MILFRLGYSFICLTNQALSVTVLVEFRNLKALNLMDCRWTVAGNYAKYISSEIHNAGLPT